MSKKWLSATGAMALAGLALVLLVATQSSAAPGQAGCAAAALSPGSDFEIYDQRLPWTNEQHPDAVYNPDKDEYMVVFDWDLNGSGERDIMAITVTAEGVVGHDPISITTDSSHDDTYPAIAYNPDSGKYLVVWQRWNSFGGSAIVGSIVSDTAGAEIPLYIGGTFGDLLYPDVAYGPGPGRFLMVWQTHAPPGLLRNIFGATLDGAGADIRYIRISPDDPTLGHHTYPAVANDGSTGRWLVVWNNTRIGGTTDHNVYGQQVQYSSGSVSLWGGLTPIGTSAADPGAPAVDWGPVGGGSGEFLTVWTESVNTVSARRVQADNALAGDPITVSNTEIDKANAAVAYAASSNEWWVAWESG